MPKICVVVIYVASSLMVNAQSRVQTYLKQLQPAEFLAQIEKLFPCKKQTGLLLSPHKKWRIICMIYSLRSEFGQFENKTGQRLPIYFLPIIY